MNEKWNEQEIYMIEDLRLTFLPGLNIENLALIKVKQEIDKII